MTSPADRYPYLNILLLFSSENVIRENCYCFSIINNYECNDNNDHKLMYMSDSLSDCHLPKKDSSHVGN